MPTHAVRDLNFIAIASRASQNKRELLTLLMEVDNIHPKTILELGCWRGWLLNTWDEAFADAQEIIGIEIDNNNIDLPASEGSKKISIYNGNTHNVKTLEQIKKFLRYAKVENIDFLFIDGDHMYEGVKADFEMYSPLVRKGGIIAFHDISLRDNPGVEVYKFWDEIKTKYKYLEVVYPGGTGTGILYL